VLVCVYVRQNELVPAHISVCVMSFELPVCSRSSSEESSFVVAGAGAKKRGAEQPIGRTTVRAGPALPGPHLFQQRGETEGHACRSSPEIEAQLP
jgi:hypothetical protein